MRADPTVPVHLQPMLIAKHGRMNWPCEYAHRWFNYRGLGVVCSDEWGNHGCGEIRLRLDGRRSYRGRHRR